MSPASDEDFTPAEMRRWIERVEKANNDLRDFVERRFGELQREVQRAAFVPIVLYQAEKDAEKERINGRFESVEQRFEEVDRRLNNVRATAWTVAGLVLTGIGVLLGVFKAVGL